MTFRERCDQWNADISKPASVSRDYVVARLLSGYLN